MTFPKGRFKFKKITSGDYAKCYYCDEKTHSALYDTKDGSEVWCCSKCALKYGKIKRLRKYSNKNKSLKKNGFSFIKKSKNTISKEVCE